MATARWLHLTDFHQGVKGQSTFWPTIRSVFMKDLEEMQRRIGGLWDLVLFTGDLTQSGIAQQFQQLDTILNEILAKIEQISGSRPVMLPVPGNHDLVRPSRDTDVALAQVLYNSWHGDAAVRDKLWNGKTAYLNLIKKAFSPYNAWLAKWRKENPFPAGWTCNTGKLPGDFSLTVVKDELRLGLVGLNSAFLQLQGGDCNGRIDIATEQFHAACPPDGPTWCDQHHVNLLMTHHPPAWLSTATRNERFYPDIQPPGRFLLHLFGHMHEARMTFLAQAADGVRREFQGASLYSREKWEGWKASPPDAAGETRIHGYSIGQIDWSDSRSAKMTVWPRVANLSHNQAWQFIPDHQLGLSSSPNQDSFSIDFAMRSPAAPAPASALGGPSLKAADTRRPPSLSITAPVPPNRPYDAAWYVPRPELETEALHLLDLPGQPVVLWGKKSAGKSWLLHRLVERVQDEDGDHSRATLSDLRSRVPDRADQFYRHLAECFVDALSLDPDFASENMHWVADAFSQPGTPLRRLKFLVQHYLLPRCPGRLLLALDGADSLIDSPLRDDFYGMLRSWAEATSSPGFEKLRIILAVSVPPAQLIHSLRQSPFNLTKPLKVTGLSVPQLTELARRYGLTPSPATLQHLLDETEGEIVPVRQRLYDAARGLTPLHER